MSATASVGYLCYSSWAPLARPVVVPDSGIDLVVPRAMVSSVAVVVAVVMVGLRKRWWLTETALEDSLLLPH